MKNPKHSPPLYYEYKIKPGDSLSLIMAKMFNVAPRSPRYAATMEHLLALNPHIKNPHLIRAGDSLRLGIIPQYRVPAAGAKTASPSPAPKPPARVIRAPVAAPEQDNVWALSWLEHNTSYLSAPAGIAFGASANLLSPGNVGLINEVSDLYAQYQQGNLTKNQYSYRRRLALDRLKSNIGPVERLLFGKQTTHESIRIARGGGVPATAHIAKHADRIKRLARVARNGGFVLTGVGVTASCMQIANTVSQEKKNEIFVEALGSMVVGLASGAIVGLFLVSNPVGWGTALVLAIGTTAVSYGSGKMAVAVHDASGRKVDFVNGLGVDKICR